MNRASRTVSRAIAELREASRKRWGFLAQRRGSFVRVTKDPDESRRSPRQERSKSTVSAIVEAAARVLSEAGLESVTTTRIARVAGVSIGSLYQYFPGKEAIASAMIRRQADDDVVRLEAAVEESRGLPLEERVEHILDLSLAPVLDRPRLFVFILTYLPELDLLPVARELERRTAAVMRALFEEHRDELGDVDAVAASFGGIGAMRGALLALAHHAPEVLEERERVRAVLRGVLLGAVRGEGRARAGARARARE